MATAPDMATGVTVVDVTLRDGGKVHGHRWTTSQAVRLVQACAAAGVALVEVGYYRPARHRTDGVYLPAASCPEPYLDALSAQAGRTALTVMASRRDVTPADLAPLARHGVGAVAMPVRPGEAAELLPYLRAAADAGVRLTPKVMRVRRTPIDDLLRAAEKLSAAGVYVVADSYGALLPRDVAALFARLGSVTPAALGLHAHDGQRLALANTLSALEAGVTVVDGSLCGLGVDGGNLMLEALVGHLRHRLGRTLRLTPLVRAALELVTGWLPGDPRAVLTDLLLGLLDLDPGGADVAGTDPLEALCALADAPAPLTRRQPAA
ncbi:hypothetical protein [Mangrovihabitans endophyticus]|uniref:Pyruvate carboxyltransferase domain-containing protein n=1 Tax=Mangrovihabitans endophyticus TaxID=1751298 RepID=A0A8J3FME9_9ACTN|nr:hypothetical protein [Mangrovihabitans endophyticus]GGK75464.1 hypothetical protein GCM10012284_06830 [Mangrovihabitans endophyticus]